MALISWNVRGLGEPAKRRLVKDFIVSNNYCAVVFQETKLDKTSPGILRSLSGAKLHLG